MIEVKAPRMAGPTSASRQRRWNFLRRAAYDEPPQAIGALHAGTVTCGTMRDGGEPRRSQLCVPGS